MKKSPPKVSFWLFMRLAFTGVCLVALAALLLHRQGVSAAAPGAHIHPSTASGLVLAEAAAGRADPPPSGTAPGPTPDNSAATVNTPSGQRPSGQQVNPPADGDSQSANRTQRSLSDAAATPDGLGSHPNAANPAPTLRGTVDPSQVLDTASQSLGGCLKEYGDAGQCLPVVPPSLAEHIQQMKNAGLDPASMPHNWTCSEVRVYFANGIAVRQHGVDPQHLDSNGDGTACGAAD
ncbi:hypothetical protein [Arthrobacter sp. 92]|uniref:hypothetical protein n=1 Tax=Arthrobacter sp. 92 TaxID=3418175 RepID=UPI003D01D451